MELRYLFERAPITFIWCVTGDDTDWSLRHPSYKPRTSARGGFDTQSIISLLDERSFGGRFEWYMAIYSRENIAWKRSELNTTFLILKYCLFSFFIYLAICLNMAIELPYSCFINCPKIVIRKHKIQEYIVKITSRVSNLNYFSIFYFRR